MRSTAINSAPRKASRTRDGVASFIGASNQLGTVESGVVARVTAPSSRSFRAARSRCCHAMIAALFPDLRRYRTPGLARHSTLMRQPPTCGSFGGSHGQERPQLGQEPSLDHAEQGVRWHDIGSLFGKGAESTQGHGRSSRGMPTSAAIPLVLRGGRPGDGPGTHRQHTGGRSSGTRIDLPTKPTACHPDGARSRRRGVELWNGSRFRHSAFSSSRTPPAEAIPPTTARLGRRRRGEPRLVPGERSAVPLISRARARSRS
jgi:hypothetical protein